MFLDYTQKELDDAYDQAVYAANREQVIARWTSTSEAVRQRIGAPEVLSYGPAPIEKLHLYRTKKPDAPVNVYIHGGAWRAGMARDYAFPAEVLTRAGAHYVALDFNNVLETGGDLMPMADQVRRAIAWVYRNAASFGGEPGQIYVGGQSSGAHLTAAALATDWTGEFGLPADPIKGGLCASGMYELAPVRLSARANYVKFTDDMVEKLSPIRHLERLRAPLIVSYATYETPEFQRQAREFAAALQAAGKPVELIVGENYSHTELLETLCNPYGHLGAAVLTQMGLA